MSLSTKTSKPNLQDKTTPLMAQYLAIKGEHPDCLLFFRLGDFYELFFEDAIKAAKALDITLTRRGQMDGEDIPMCGVPFHASENYLARLIRQGFHVAICEQTESPESAKKRGAKSIVKREVVRIITPGTVTEESLLDARSATILSALSLAGGAYAIAWIDLATGQPFVEDVEEEQISATLARLGPSEIILPDKLAQNPSLFEILAVWKNQLSILPAVRFNSDNAGRRLMELYQIEDLRAFGDFSRASISALGSIMDYVALTQKCDFSHIQPPRQLLSAPFLCMDAATRRNLEITRTQSGERAGSLLSTIDKTLTASGARLLASHISAPLANAQEINERLAFVAFFAKDSKTRNSLRQELRHTPDIERALARLSLGRGGPRDLAALRDGLGKSAAIKALLSSLDTNALPKRAVLAKQGLGEHSLLHDKLLRALAENLPLLARDGGFIAKGYAPQLDEIIVLRDDSRRTIAALEQSYKKESGAPNLKIRHNQVIGYYIEVSPTHADKLLSRQDLFIHRQTLASAARFTTVELSELAQKIAEAASRALAIEAQLFIDLTKDVEAILNELRQTAKALANLDVAAALAELAATHHYVRPVIDDSLTFRIKGGRHPVVEQALKSAPDPKNFVANTCDLGASQRLWLLTGPNMAGKSTFLRQNAVIVILAQMGSFVPASTAHIGVVNRLFSRVGAADDLARGQSTFMVEMVETATILNQADERSLVILDEIGRGTATYDGLSIAWATLEHLHDINTCRTLFATHYHELTQLSGKLPALNCATMLIREWERDIIFMHEVVPGTADRSYGIHVAKMAGLPAAVISRAEKVLEGLEQSKINHTGVQLADTLPLFAATLADTTANKVISPILDEIRAIEPDTLSPKEALDKLYELKNKIA